MFTKQKNILLLLFVLYGTYVMAVPAYPYPIKVKQPDGTTLNVKLRGDEFHHYYTTEDGVFITKGASGIYHYAVLDKNGTLMDTHVKANDKNVRSESEREFTSGLQKNVAVQDINRQIRAKRNSMKKVNGTKTVPAKFPKTGSPRSLVILVNYSDLSYVVPTPQTAFTNLLNQAGYNANGGTGSARDYFRDNTMGAFDPQFDVVGPYTLPNTMDYYGANDTTGYDVKPAYMIVDACKAANNAGVDFSQYDTDGDGYIDNVFVYYAGHNEAEWGGENTVWPHRFSVYPTDIYSGGNYNGTEASVTFDGKILFDYACTSELKNNTGSNMCGIGTFTHEFGHVLGLADMYATDGGAHQTLSYWDIMDAGPYLNDGRTPPAYNAFERFQLGYITPQILTGNASGTLNEIISSNNAYLIDQTDAHNLDGQNPSPTEFFLLENRQKSGWDAFLPGHGLLVYRINYDQDKWYYNIPNKDPNLMGVDIMEADGIASDATLAGDPFPGTSNVTTYELTSHTGTKWYKKIKTITETSGVINFSVEKFAAITTNAATLNFTSYINVSSASQAITVTGINITGPQLQYSLSGTDAGMFSYSGSGTLASTGGTINITFTPTSEGTKTAQLIVTDGTIQQTVSLSGVATYPPLGIPAVPADGSSIITGSNNFTATWTAVTDAESYELNVYTRTVNSGINTVLSENFALLTNGSPNGSASSNDISNNFNTYMQIAGWTGSKVFEAGGSAKIGSSGSLGSLVTPFINLSSEGGVFTLKFDAMAWKNDATSMKIYLDNVLVQTVTNLNNSNYTFSPYSFTLSGGKSNSKIKFEGKQASSARFFLDNVVITQNSNGVIVPITNSPFATTQTSYQITGLNSADKYYYTVSAVKGAQKSAPSNEVGPINLIPTGIFPVSYDILQVWTKDNNILFHAKAGKVVTVYNVSGQKIIEKPTVEGLNTLETKGKGIMIIKIDNQIGRVVL